MFDVADLSQRCRSAAGEDLSTLSDDELLAAAVGWESVRSGVETAEARVLAELRVRGVTDQRFGLRTQQWVAAEAKCDRREVNRRLRFGLAVRRLNAVTDAVASGALSKDHAAVLAEAAANPRVGDQVEAGQSVWIELAQVTSFVDWKHQLEHTVALLDQDGGYDPNRDLARNRLHLTPLPDGSVGVAGELVGEQALVFRQCVEAHADRLFLRLKADHELCPELLLPSRATVVALAAAELVLRGSTVDRGDTSTGPACDVTLVIQATKPHPQGSTGPTGVTDPTGARDLVDRREPAEPGRWPEVFDPYHRIALVDRADRGGHNPLTDHCGPATTPDGFHVPHHVAACLLCDPVITALIEDALGVPLDMGRQIRLANREQRRALKRRDGGCVFPGCDAPVGWCDAHHVTWWDDDGPTDIKNLALLCRYHHGVTHRSGWTMTATAGQRFTWTTPLGQTLHSQRHRGRSPTGRHRRRLQPA